MGKRFVPYEKLSKKKRRALDGLRRGDWGGVNPVTKRPERTGVYKRRKVKADTQSQAYSPQEDDGGPRS